jgi:hypothetical protein
LELGVAVSGFVRTVVEFLCRVTRNHNFLRSASDPYGASTMSSNAVRYFSALASSVGTESYRFSYAPETIELESEEEKDVARRLESALKFALYELIERSEDRHFECALKSALERRFADHPSASEPLKYVLVAENPFSSNSFFAPANEALECRRWASGL